MRDIDHPRLEEQDLAEKLKSFDGSDPTQLEALIKSFLPPVDSAKVQEIRATLACGEKANPKELLNVLMFGSVEERLALRAACSEPAAVARNQDLNLSKLTDALVKGDRGAKSGYESSRTIIPETLPEWARIAWEESKSATWRTLDLHGDEFQQFARRVRGQADDEFKEISIGVYDPASRPDNSLLHFDERGSFLTYAVGSRYIFDMVEFATRRHHPRAELFVMANIEIRQGLRALGSPSIIGAHFRRVADHELRILFAAHVVEDACVAFSIPLDNASKLKLLKQIELNPWILCGQLKLERLREPLAFLRSNGSDEAAVGVRASEFIFKPGALSSFNQSRKPKVAPTVIVPARLESSEVWPPPQLVESRRTAIAKALEASPFKASFDVKRQTRLIMKLVSDSETLFHRAVSLLAMRGTPDAIVAELQARRVHSAFRPDQPPPKAIPVETPTQEKAETIEATPAYSKRLLFKALLESYYRMADLDKDRAARILAKLTNESEQLFSRAIQAVESGQDLELVISDLRQRRAPSSRIGAMAPATAVMSPALIAALEIGVREAPREEFNFTFSRHAEKTLQDGSIRHVVHQALERYAERPDLADLKKISIDGNFWELRLLRENLRVYFVKLAEHEIRILRIGSKGDQGRDISELNHTYQLDCRERADLLQRAG